MAAWRRGSLLDPGEGDLSPSGGGRFQRFAEVVAAEAAGADRARVLREWPDVVDPSKNLPISGDKAAVRSKVVLKLAPEGSLPAVAEVHVQLPAEASAVLRRHEEAAAAV